MHKRHGKRCVGPTVAKQRPHPAFPAARQRMGELLLAESGRAGEAAWQLLGLQHSPVVLLFGILGRARAAVRHPAGQAVQKAPSQRRQARQLESSGQHMPHTRPGGSALPAAC